MFLLGLLLLFNSGDTLFSETSETIRSGRPGQAIDPYVVGTGFLQIQSGIDIADSKGLTPGEDIQSENLNSVFRLGVHERVEFNGFICFSK